jgi:hypothetical protein
MDFLSGFLLFCTQNRFWVQLKGNLFGPWKKDSRYLMIFREIRTSNSFKDFPCEHSLSTWLFSSCILHVSDDFSSDCVDSRTVDNFEICLGGNMLTRDCREFLTFV